MGADANLLNAFDQHIRETRPILEPAGPLLVGNGTLHHLGVVVASISAVAKAFAASISGSWDGQVIEDPLQRVRVSFFKPFDSRNPVIELVEPALEDSPVTQRTGLHHVCYEIDNLESGLKAARVSGLLLVSPPKPAVAFAGRRIAWVSSKNRLLIEFLEREQS